jgi:thiamine biosynthesis lipoprotein
MFLRIVAGLVLILPCFNSFFRAQNAQAAERFAFEKAEMGVPFRVTLYAPDEVTAKTAADAAFSKVEALNAIFSDYDSDSELSRLSDSSGRGRPVPVSDDLWSVMNFAQAVAVRSHGAFDMTMGPVINLWRNARHKKEMPKPEKLAEALARTGYQAVHLDSATHTVELLKPRMRLDAGGIAKGYAAAEALKVLEQNGFPEALVAAGGDIAAGAPPPDSAGWRVEITALDAEGAPASRFLQVAHCNISTSGDLYQRLEFNGKRYSHIVDPMTGIGLTDHSLVTVIARDGMTADAFSKVLSVLGPERGLAMIEEVEGAAAHVVRWPESGLEEKFSKRWAGFERHLNPGAKELKSEVRKAPER